MSMYHIRKPSFLEVSRNQSTPTTSLNTTDISVHNTNLENYKKALHSIVKRLNKTPSASSKTSLKRSDSKLNQTQQPIYNTLLNTSNSSKKYHVNNASTSVNRNQSCSRRSHSNDRPYVNNKDLLNKSMQEPYIKKGSFSSNISKSISINKLEKQESQDIDDLGEGEFLNSDNNCRRNSVLNATILHDVDLNNLDGGDGDKKLRDLVHQYQLRDAIHRQEITKLKKSNELLRTHVYELEKELDKSKKNKDSEKRYITKLESELSQFKERVRLEANEKKSIESTMFEQKESQYLKAIDELKAQLTNMSSEKKLVEHLLKNALTQHDQNKVDKQPSNGTHKGLDTSILAATSGKYSANAGGRPKPADAFTKKASAMKLNDENDYASYSQSQTANSSFIANSVKISKDFDTLKENKQVFSISGNGNMNKILQEGGLENKQVGSILGNGNMNKILQEGSLNNSSAEQVPTEGDEAFPTKVFHPQVNEKSLKERMDLNKFKLDLSVISKNRKVG